MGLILVDKDRRVVPRWRDSQATAETREMDREVIDPPRSVDPQGRFEEKLELWKRERSAEAAADVVAAALVIGRPHDAEEPARFLLEAESSVTASVSNAAWSVLQPAETQLAPLLEVRSTQPVQELRTLTRALKRTLVDFPRTPFTWVDLSRAYAILGVPGKSSSAMHIALALAPENRFVLRSAARLFLHLQEPDRAHELLKRCRATRIDPWLLSAEIATACVAGKTSTFVKIAREMVRSSSYAPLHVGELASALATLEMKAGDLKPARKLFRQSLIDPTENSVAQAGWASRRIAGVELNPSHFEVPRSFEAQAWKYFNAMKWEDALRCCGNWLADESFSSRPAEMGSYVAAAIQEDFALCESLALSGLRANPSDIVLRNNLIVALANQGRMTEAKEMFSTMSSSGQSRTTICTLLATEGLLHFRSGNPEGGRALYRRAMELAGEASLQRVRTLAAVHLAREEILARTENANEALAAASAECTKSKEVDTNWMLEKLKRQLPSGMVRPSN